MTVEQAREILRRNKDAWDAGSIGNEDAATVTHARLLMEAGGNA
jgi:hypothetical protein